MPIKNRIKKTALAVLIFAAFIFFLGNALLAHWVTRYVNREIAALDGYSGSVADIDIHLWRGAYEIKGLDIYKTGGGMKMPFIAAESIDLSVEWRALWRGVIVAEMDIRNIALNFANNQTGKEANWAQFIDNLTPFDINRLGVQGGRIAYTGYSENPEASLFIEDIRAEVTNLRNVDEMNAKLPSSLFIEGTSIGDGKLLIKGAGNILKDIPDFDIDARLEQASIPAFNSYTRNAGIDFSSGVISVYSELAAADGRVTGYIKPIATEVRLIDAEQDRNPLDIVWESIAAVFMTIFKNQPRDQFAMRIPIEGEYNDPESGALAAFLSIFQNAFGKAFPRATDGSIDFEHAVKVED